MDMRFVRFESEHGPVVIGQATVKKILPSPKQDRAECAIFCIGDEYPTQIVYGTLSEVQAKLEGTLAS